MAVEVLAHCCARCSVWSEANVFEVSRGLHAESQHLPEIYERLGQALW